MRSTGRDAVIHGHDSAGMNGEGPVAMCITMFVQRHSKQRIGRLELTAIIPALLMRISRGRPAAKNRWAKESMEADL
ncbi:hypothetical protein [Paenibacillus sp. sgz500958]|uniref:hypothetical protein n=1 Tax=Paenibacillus sp. sgz500958 TaxID=3242475 RepID=UPI0036D297A4